jgi:hypothetical protein
VGVADGARGVVDDDLLAVQHGEVASILIGAGVGAAAASAITAPVQAATAARPARRTIRLNMTVAFLIEKWCGAGAGAGAGDIRKPAGGRDPRFVPTHRVAGHSVVALASLVAVGGRLAARVALAQTGGTRNFLSACACGTPGHTSWRRHPRAGLTYSGDPTARAAPLAS